MLGTRSRRRAAAPLALLVAGPIGLGAVFAAPMLQRIEPPLQRLADEAALAGVNALAASAALTPSRRAAVARAAAQRMIGSRKAAIGAVTPSTDELQVSVELADPATKRRATATARYLLPSAGRVDQRAASVSAHAGPPAHL